MKLIVDESCLPYTEAHIMTADGNESTLIVPWELVHRWNAHDELVAICQEFVDKVESGKARSVQTYTRMKAALALENKHAGSSCNAGDKAVKVVHP